MTEPRDIETTDAVPADDLTLDPPVEPDVPDLEEPTSVTITGDNLVVTEDDGEP